VISLPLSNNCRRANRRNSNETMIATRMAIAERPQTGIGDRLWNDQAAIAEKKKAEQRDALPRIRQRAEHREIPEQDLEQERRLRISST